MTLPILLAILALVVSICNGIFRNQLSAIGDKVSANKVKVARFFRLLFSLALSYGLPIFYIVRATLYEPLSKGYVILIAFFMCALCLNLVLDAMRISSRRQHNQTMTILGLMNAQLDITKGQLNNEKARQLELDIVKLHQQMDHGTITKEDALKEVMGIKERLNALRPETSDEESTSYN